MKSGKVEKIKWGKYESPYFYFPPDWDGAECGGFALYTLTKVPYEKIEKLSQNGNWPDSVMFSFLKKHGCKVIPITMGNVVMSQSVKDRSPKLNSKNVILLEQACYKEESTWSVLYGGRYAHSGDNEELKSMEFVNFPIVAAYLISHKDWK